MSFAGKNLRVAFSASADAFAPPFLDMLILTAHRAKEILNHGKRASILVIGDAMLDCFVSGEVSRISPEAPVPILRFQSESFMPGGAANVARNLTSLGAPTAIFAVTGQDREGRQLKSLLKKERVDCRGLYASAQRTTCLKTRIVARQQQIVRVDREIVQELSDAEQAALQKWILEALPGASAVILGDYDKGAVTDFLLAFLKEECRRREIWISLDPKPVHKVNLADLSLITPNRKEAFQLAGLDDATPQANPLEDKNLRLAVSRLLRRLRPAVLLITLGEQGMLLCRRGRTPILVSTLAQEVFDVSGAGDTAIASFTLAIAAGASPLEAAVFSNRAAGIVVGKKGTATVSGKELLASFEERK